MQALLIYYFLESPTHLQWDFLYIPMQCSIIVKLIPNSVNMLREHGWNSCAHGIKFRLSWTPSSFWFFAMADFVLVFMFFHRVFNCVHFPLMTPSFALNSVVIFSHTELFFKIVFLSFCLLLIIPSRDSTRSNTTDFSIAVKFGNFLGFDILCEAKILDKVSLWPCSWSYLKTKICLRLLFGHILVLS